MNRIERAKAKDAILKNLINLGSWDVHYNMVESLRNSFDLASELRNDENLLRILYGELKQNIPEIIETNLVFSVGRRDQSSQSVNKYGLELLRDGGFEQIELDKERAEISYDKLKHDHKLSKMRSRTFWIIFILAILGSIYALIDLLLTYVFAE